MKRLLDTDDTSTSKRLRKQDDDISTVAVDSTLAEDLPPFARSLPMRTAADVYQMTQNDEILGYMRLIVRMKWPLPNKLKYQVSTAEDDTDVRFEILFAEPCCNYIKSAGLAPVFGDQLFLSLKDVTVERQPKSESPASSNRLPMTLVYHEGVSLQFSQSRDTNKIGQSIDTWAQSNGGPLNQHDPFAAAEASPTPIDATSMNDAAVEEKNATMNRFSKKAEKKAERIAKKLQKRAAAQASAATDDTLHAGPVSGSVNARAATTSPQELATTPASSLSKKVETPAPEAANSLVQYPARLRPQSPTVTNPQTAPSQKESASQSAKQSTSNDSDPVLDLKPGCYPADSLIQYPPIRDLTTGRRLNVIGVVLSVQQKRTSSAQSMCRVVLMDPSIYNSDNPEAGFGVNCFTEQEADNISGAKRGDVILLRVVQISEKFDHKMGVCGSRIAWSWALFSPESGTVTPTGPASRMTFKPSQTELNYCIKLGDWWRAVQEQRNKDMGANATVVHDLTEYASKEQPRVHRLIQDAAPDAPPGGYFDCTIEVLKTHRNDNGVWSVYVTDYTRNESLPASEASWSDSSLKNCILKVEMWDEAADVAAKMQSGEYYSIKNMRMRVSGGGYWEAKCVQAKKIKRLDDDELESEPHLKDLLRRKKEWEDHLVETDHFSHKLFQEAELDVHFDCTAHVLHVSLKENGRAFIYITDYTPRKNLTDIPATAHWTGNIPDDRIVKVALSGAPAETAQILNADDYIAIRRLRLKSYSNGKDVSGRLGGEEQLIFKLNPVGSGNGHLHALLRRQKEWKKQTGSNQHKAISGQGDIPRPKIAANHNTRMYEVHEAFTVKEIQEYEGPPAVFEPVVARIVDFWPEKLHDCVILRCTLCNEDIPENLRICTKCDDSMDTHVRPVYRFFFEIEDENGDRLQVSACHPECDFLKDLPPVDLHEDEEALEALTERLEPLLGKLIVEHARLIDSGEEGRVRPDWEQPLLKMTIAGFPKKDSESSQQFHFLKIDSTPLT